MSPGLHLEPYDPAADRRALESLAQACEPFSPSVGLEEAERPECLLLDITGLEPLLGNEAALAEQVLRFVASQGFAARTAIADTVAAAWAAARYAQTRVAGVERSEPPAAQSWGLTAFDPSHPCVYVPPRETLTALAKLPVAALRLGPATLALLAELGIQRIEQVLALPRESLASRFESELVRRLDQLSGILPERIDAVRAPPEIAVEQALETPTGRRDVVEMIVEQLLARTVEQLSARRRGAVQLECELTCQGGLWDGAALRPTVRLRLGLYRPTAERRHLLELVRMRLERTVLAGPVSAVRLTVPLTAPLVARQLALGELLADEPGRTELIPFHELALLIDRLSSRLGREAVLGATLVADAQPELAYRLAPLAGSGFQQTQPRRKKAKARTMGPIGRMRPISPISPIRPISPIAERAALARPLRLAPQPQPVEVLAAVPEGPPARFCLNGQPQRIARTWGPERIQTGWWRGPWVARDYYRVETAGGERFWLFRRISDGQWFLHAAFE